MLKVGDGASVGVRDDHWSGASCPPAMEDNGSYSGGSSLSYIYPLGNVTKVVRKPLSIVGLRSRNYCR